MSDERRIAKTGDIFSLDRLIGWLAMQPADREYSYHNCAGGCLLTQFIRAHGHQDGMAGTDVWWPTEPWVNNSILKSGKPLPREFDLVAFQEPHTYGAALERARAAAR